jgi:polysaccharide biosynthesis transport protein
MIQYSHQDSPMSPQSFLSVVSKRRGLIIFVFLVIVVAVGVGMLLMPPIYRASAKVMINYQVAIEKEHLLNLFQIQDKSYYERLSSELVIFKMRSILEPVVTELGLDKQEAGESMEAQVSHDRAIEALAVKLQVEREKDTNVLIISYEDHDPKVAAAIVGRVVSEFIKQRPSLDRDDRASESFDKQIQQITIQIENAEKRSMEYKSREKVISPTQQTSILFESLSAFDHELSKVRAERIAHEANLKVLREQVAQEKDLIIPSTEASNGLSQNTYYNTLKNTMLSLEIKKAALLQKYTEKHFEVVTLTAEMEATREKIKEAQADIIRGEEAACKALQAQESALTYRMNQVVGSISDLSRQDYELGRISIGVPDLHAVYSMLVRQREEARIANSQKEYLIQVRLLEPALIPNDSVKPNKPLYLSLSVLLGLLIAFGLAFFVEYFDHSVNTAEDAQECLQMPILASIADFQVENYRRRKQADEDRTTPRVKPEKA